MKCKESLQNDFGEENHDEFRYGKLTEENAPLFVKFKSLVKGAINTFSFYKNNIYRRITNEYGRQFERMYNRLDEQGKELLVNILAYRVMGSKKIKLSTNNDLYFSSIAKVDKLKDETDFIDPHFLGILLYKFDLRPIGYDIKFYFSSVAIVIDFILEQYAYKAGGKPVVSVEKDDVVLDIGACWGDTALYFAGKTGVDGKVYSFEFIPGNINIFKRNRALNPSLEERIQLVPNPVSDTSGQQIYFKEIGRAHV